jgi:Xaa-Pro aminopeptidase
MKQANFSASRAKIRFLKWLSDTSKAKKPLSELDVSNAMEACYQQEPNFKGLSFNTIASVGANASIVHYGTPSNNVFVQPGEFLLVDSGAHYLGGTTDDTRTLIVGEPDEKQIYVYTQVLKAHINAAAQKFPKGTTGVQIDALARAPMWQCGLDYGHGTGHGVGAFLNVHEGPNGIHKRAVEPLQPGMVNSIEPGYYEPGWGGIRLENLYLVQAIQEKTPGSSTSTVPQYRFEPLTWIPFDLALVQLEALTEDQLQWLKDYHAKVVELMLPTLSPEEGHWLESYCAFSF